MPEQLSDAEQARRRDDVARIRLSIELDGGRCTAQAVADQEDFASGRIDEAELLSRFRAHYRLGEVVPAGRPPGTGYLWESDPAHPWWPGYLDTKWWGLAVGEFVWRNAVGATTAEELAVREADAVAVRGLTLRLHEIPATFDLAGLVAIHAHLFGDVYPWAGQVRTNNVAQGPPFARPAQIENLMGQVAGHIAGTDLTSLSDEEYADNLARIYHILTVCRPFHTGNGPAQREFVSALARTAGRALDWHRLSRPVHDFASLRARRDRDLGALIAMFGELIGSKAAA